MSVSPTHRLSRIALFALLLCLVAGCASRGAPQDAPGAIDLPRLMGTWHVIAHIPYFAERGHVAARYEYALRDTDKVGVRYHYREDFADFDVKRAGTSIGRLKPSKRLYDAPPQPTTEAGIHASWHGDLYLVIGDPQPGGGYAVRAYFNPLVRFIWLGALIMFIGGGISLSDRRLRIGVPAGRGRRPVAVPAE